eukprot:TRINITY_DN7265_c0_g1_i1.p2 TRINITY_DN7265_c0_g1~~TRINITY_DN7265_c0_g1_i1.p2  ORF type:complete len:196 (-),score=55.11 TRINITY_DN7265_c0_g1_i1:344-931(-)
MADSPTSAEKKKTKTVLGNPVNKDREEYTVTGASGREVKLIYMLHDNCGFRASELKEFAWAFMVSDILEDGTITTTEAKKALVRLGEDPTPKEWDAVLSEVDPHSRGVMDFQRFVKLMARFDRSMITEEELTNAFKLFDKDGSGSIDAIELRDVLTKLGFGVGMLDAQKMIDEADETGSGEVTFGEFVGKIMKNQ